MMIVFLHKESEVCNYGDQCERNLCIFRHNDNEDSCDVSECEDSCSDNDDDKDCVKTLINPSLVATQEDVEEGKEESELVEFTIFVPCKAIFLSNYNNYYTKEHNDMEEIDKVDHLWINPESGMKVGTYLETY